MGTSGTVELTAGLGSARSAPRWSRVEKTAGDGPVIQVTSLLVLTERQRIATQRSAQIRALMTTTAQFDLVVEAHCNAPFVFAGHKQPETAFQTAERKLPRAPKTSFSLL